MCECFGFPIGECLSITRCELYDECAELEGAMKEMAGIIVIVEEGEDHERRA